MKLLVITAGIYPLGSGAKLASSGMCHLFSKYRDMVVFSLLDKNENMSAVETISFPFEAHFYYSKGYENIVREALFKPIDFVRAKLSFLKPLYKRFTQDIVRYLQSGEVDVVIVDHVIMGLYMKFLKKKFPEIIFIYNSHNVEYLNTYAEYYELAHFDENFIGTIKKKIALRRCAMRKNMESWLIENANNTFCISMNDKSVLGKEFGHSDKLLYSKPIIEFEPIKDITDMDTYTKNLLIVGSMNWYPNVSGIIWFINNVFAKLVTDDPEYHLYIVGRNPHKELVEVAGKVPNVIVTGSVPSTDEYFEKCDISIVPVFEGTGAKIKVLESIARRIPTVCSEFAAKDYSVNGEIMVATTEKEFIDCIKQIEKSAILRRKLYEDMVQYYNNYFKVSDELLEAVKAE